MDDLELISLALAGDEPAFGRLVARHLDAAYAFALRFTGDAHDADDIAQESFVKVWKNLKRYNKESAGFKTWLMRIVRNTAVDHLRKRKHIPFSAFEDSEGHTPFEHIAGDEPSAEESLLRAAHSAEVERALGELPPVYREVLALYYSDEMTFEQVAAVLEASVNTVKSRHRRALHRLREIVRI